MVSCEAGKARSVPVLRDASRGTAQVLGNLHRRTAVLRRPLWSPNYASAPLCSEKVKTQSGVSDPEGQGEHVF